MNALDVLTLLKRKVYKNYHIRLKKKEVKNWTRKYLVSSWLFLCFLEVNFDAVFDNVFASLCANQAKKNFLQFSAINYWLSAWKLSEIFTT